MKFLPLLLISFFVEVSWSLPIEFGFRVNSGQQQLADENQFDKYFELEMNLQYHFTNFFAARLGGLGRFTDEHNYGGLEFSAPLILEVKSLGLSTYMAPGYRYLNRGLSSPTLESGVTFRSLGNFGLGYRLILNDWVKNGLKTEGQIFFSLHFGTRP